MKSYLLIFILSFFGGVSHLSATISPSTSPLSLTALEIQNSSDLEFSMKHSTKDHSNTPFSDYSQIETEDEEEKLKNSLKRSTSNNFIYLSPFKINQSRLLPDSGSIQQHTTFFNLDSSSNLSTPIYIRISVFRI